MSTDEATADRCVLVAIAYLRRNDFTSIRQLSRHLLLAKDGRRPVYVWLSMDPPRADGRFAIPSRVFRLAFRDRARVDAISMDVNEECLSIRHMMNA